MSQSTVATLGGKPSLAQFQLTPLMVNHAAWVTHDVQATADFYTKIMGMELASTVMEESVKSTGDDIPFLHIFFRMQDGSTIAFFEAPGLPERPTPTHRAYEIFDHLAMQAVDRPEVDKWSEWLRSNGLAVIGPIDHDGLVYSIYFHDNNGLRLEITTPIDPKWNMHTERGQVDLAAWCDTKNRARAEGRDVKEALVEYVKSRKH